MCERLISFSPQSSRLVAYSSTLIGIIFSVISRLGILYPAKQKIIADAAAENAAVLSIIISCISMYGIGVPVF